MREQGPELPVFVLNLPRHTERRALAEAELARVGMSATIMEGVDGAALPAEALDRYDGRRCRAIYGLDLLPTELGCYLGHERVLRHVIEAGIDVALVLEDDIRLDDDLDQVLKALLRGPRPWQVVRLSGMRDRKVARAVARCQPACRLGPRHALYRLPTHILGAQGYVITREGAQRMLAYGQRVFLPWDQTLDRYWENGIVPWVVHPFPVHHREEVPSIIGTRDPCRRYDQGTLALWRRRLNRWRDGLAKRWYALRHP